MKKEAAQYIDQHVSAVSTAVKHNKPLSNKYWKMWDTLSEEIQNMYLQTNSLPETYKNVRGIKVQQIDSISGNVLKIYNSLSDVIKEYNISVKTIKTASKNGTVHANYKWRVI